MALFLSPAVGHETRGQHVEALRKEGHTVAQISRTHANSSSSALDAAAKLLKSPVSSEGLCLV
jgi:hypothetical protein